MDDCHYCQESIPAGTGIRDDEQVSWLGDKAPVWCSELCRDTQADSGP